MAQRFIKTIDKYIGTLTDETDPDIVIARLDITIIEEKRLFFFSRTSTKQELEHRSCMHFLRDTTHCSTLL